MLYDYVTESGIRLLAAQKQIKGKVGGKESLLILDSGNQGCRVRKGGLLSKGLLPPSLPHH